MPIICQEEKEERRKQTGLTIYHNDKQPFSDEQQKYRSENRHHQQHPTSSVEHELRDFDRIQITDKEDAATRIMTYESEIKTNNSMAEGSSDDIVGSEEGTKAINNGNEASAVSLNDKINEIYRKIEKIEGDYYDGKGKIIEISERRMSSSSLNDSARIETLSINDSPDIRNDEAKVNSPQNIQQLETFHENIQRPVSIENNIYETDENEWPEASNGNEIKSQETSKADYNYENFVADENQQNFIPSQAYDDALTTENDYTSTLQAYQNQGEFGQVQHHMADLKRTCKFWFLGYDASDVQTNNAIYDNAQYSYDSTQQNYENYVDPQQNQQQQQQESEYVYSHHDNTQQQDENSFNPSHSQQLDSNYQHGNYDDAQEISSNYTNDFDAGVYYDYDQSQQQQQQPQTYYDDPNYSHEQSEEYQEQTPQLYYENIDNNKVEMNQEQPNDDNFEYSENIAYNLSSDENHSQQIIETPQTDIYNISNSDMNVYESQPTSEMMPLETVNYEQIPEQNYENVAKMSAVGDESTTNMTSLSELSNPLNINSEREKDFNDSNRPSKKDDIKLVKQLLDSESDDTTTRSNLLKTSIKEETDESDFDISAS
ncbi:CLUMA_CG020744, isoform A [Clunio marinus]|uniref:CLUMA_CG020744, isoform A n=1 Tax=Clunio marinus TaxID=568069 RepID=A0A1J1J8K0_9DIPT|nr:CLUMA_CG020744, isoform A [Clunio marinus]